MYRRAELYDLVYGWKDYDEEARRVEAVIDRLAPHARTLLDVACGTGRHLAAFARRFEVEGTDLDEALLAVARERVPGVPLHAADMASLDLGRTFDVVTCLFSSIGYTRTLERMRAAVAAMARHVAPGGVLVVEPWMSPGDYRPGYVHLDAVEGDPTVARMGVSVLDGREWTIEFQYLTGRDGRIEHHVEHHRLGAFTRDEYLAAFVDAGMDVEHDAEGVMGRGLFIGTWPAE